MMEKGESLVTVSFTRDYLACVSLMTLDEVLNADVLTEGIGDLVLTTDLPNKIRFWIDQLRALGAFDSTQTEMEWSDPDLHFMERLWQAYEAYFQEVHDIGGRADGEG